MTIWRRENSLLVEPATEYVFKDRELLCSHTMHSYSGGTKFSTRRQEPLS